ncbi:MULTISPECIES: MMPL family transporter [unclassified Iodidimonas]|uniref:MMPL family transporter n=1 Tax=unclassified Iodidimonas TaxID=2626145 RepID=UPI00248304A9|nr:MULTISPECIES: MMPL family transporter [unclassified Iodidimonas]
MKATFETYIERVLSFVVTRAWQKPWRVVAILGLLVLLSVYAAITSLGINTDSSQMIDRREAFRQNAIAMDRAFPKLRDQILVIIRAETPDEADHAASELAKALRQRRDLFSEVFAPRVDPYFQRQGLLFLPLDDLMDLTGRLSSAAPLLQSLVLDPSLSTFFTELGRISEASEDGVDLPMIAGAYDAVNETVSALNQGEAKPLSWQQMFGEKQAINQNVLVVHPVLDYQSLQPARAAIDGLYQAIAGLPAPVLDAASIAITGDLVLRTEELKSVSQGIEISALISLVLVAVILVVGLGRWQYVVAALASLLVSILLTSGAAAVLIGELNLVSIAFTVLLIGLGIDFAIHLILAYAEQSRDHDDQGAAMVQAIEKAGPALALAALTTSVAFFAFVPTRFVGMAQLGVISGTGVLLAFIIAMTLIPALLSIFPSVKISAKPNGIAAKVAAGRTIRRLQAFGQRFSAPLAGLLIVMGFLSLGLMDKVRFDADPMHLRDPQSPGVVAFNLLFDRPQDFPYRLNYLSPSPDAAMDFAQKAEELASVEAAITLNDFIPDEQDLKLAEIDFLAGDLVFVLQSGDDLAARMAALPPTDAHAAELAVADLITDTQTVSAIHPDGPAAEAAARLNKSLQVFFQAARHDPVLYDRLDEALMRYFPMQMEHLRLQLTARPVEMESLPPAISRRFISSDGLVRVEVLPAHDVRDQEARRIFVDEVAAISPDLSGGAISVLRAGDVVGQAMVQASVLALALGSILIFVLIRRIGFIFIVMAPILLAGVLTAAIGVLIGLPFNFANVIVLPLLIGLGVDSAIHLAMRARHMALEKPADPGQSGMAALFSSSTPRAVVLSAMTTIGSFGSLALSQHRGTASMGVLLMIAISITVLTTLVVLPFLLRFADGLSKRLKNKKARKE